MQIFISWSGEPAREMAEFLHGWLPKVIQALDPFMSKKDIDKGSRWSAELAGRLDSSTQAIVCVTRENQSAEWLNFEAGAIITNGSESRARTLLLGVSPSDITGPLSEFQHTNPASYEDMWQLIQGVNNKCERPLSESLLQETFGREWPHLENKIEEVVEHARLLSDGVFADDATRVRSDEDVLAEIVERVREIDRTRAEDHNLLRMLAVQIAGRGGGGYHPSLFEERPTDPLDLEGLAEREREMIRALRGLGEGATLEFTGSDGRTDDGYFVDFVIRGEAAYVRFRRKGSGKVIAAPIKDFVGYRASGNLFDADEPGHLPPE
ncbi:TIR domain-containing protein [Tsukamurella hominis]|uniref:TIR domain-containing protein n=1 Tax=Tsukamurella hominis TaxID=1970232 RepID=UPI0039EAFC1B